MNKLKHLLKRTRLQAATWIGLPLVVVGGWFYPLLGFLLLGCMIGAVGIAYWNGRAWCDWMCPRGSFYDLFFQKVNKKRDLPSFMKSKSFRIGVVVFLFLIIGIQWFFAWGDWLKMGLSLVRILTTTTVIGIFLAFTFFPRAWCNICPMGTLASFIGKGKNPLKISSKCTQCGMCVKVCPMQLRPLDHKETGIMLNGDCLKCSTCVVHCPVKALSFEKVTIKN